MKKKVSSYKTKNVVKSKASRKLKSAKKSSSKSKRTSKKRKQHWKNVIVTLAKLAGIGLAYYQKYKE